MEPELQRLVDSVRNCDTGAAADLLDFVTIHPRDYSELLPVLIEALTDLENRDFAAYTLAKLGLAASSAGPRARSSLGLRLRHFARLRKREGVKPAPGADFHAR